MANIKSQLKRIKTNRLATERNKAVKERVQDGHPSLPRGGRLRQRRAGARGAQVRVDQLDKAVSKGVIHKNQAANKKSAMAKRAASL